MKVDYTFGFQVHIHSNNINVSNALPTSTPEKPLSQSKNRNYKCWIKCKSKFRINENKFDSSDVGPDLIQFVYQSQTPLAQ